MTVASRPSDALERAGLEALLLDLPEDDLECQRIVLEWAPLQTDGRRVARILRLSSNAGLSRLVLEHIPAAAINDDLLRHVAIIGSWQDLGKRGLLPDHFIDRNNLLPRHNVESAVLEGDWDRVRRFSAMARRLSESGARLGQGETRKLIPFLLEVRVGRSDGALDARETCMVEMLESLSHFQDLTTGDLSLMALRLSSVNPVFYAQPNIAADAWGALTSVLGHPGWDNASFLNLAREAPSRPPLYRALARVPCVRSDPALRPTLLEHADNEALFYLGLDAQGEELRRITRALGAVGQAELVRLIAERSKAGLPTPVEPEIRILLLESRDPSVRMEAVALLRDYSD